MIYERARGQSLYTLIRFENVELAHIQVEKGGVKSFPCSFDSSKHIMEKSSQRLDLKKSEWLSPNLLMLILIFAEPVSAHCILINQSIVSRSDFKSDPLTIQSHHLQSRLILHTLWLQG